MQENAEKYNNIFQEGKRIVINQDKICDSEFHVNFQ